MTATLSPMTDAQTKQKAEPKLSPTMQAAMAEIKQHGALERMPGGFWARPDAGWNGSAPNAPWWGTSTVQALTARDVAQYTKWQENKHGGRFPIRVESATPPQGGTE
jgi:hypothetical protein